MNLKTRQLNDIDKLVSQRLTNIRIRRGFSQYRLGKVLKVSLRSRYRNMRMVSIVLPVENSMHYPYSSMYP